jgi:hypothetical protein
MIVRLHECRSHRHAPQPAAMIDVHTETVLLQTWSIRRRRSKITGKNDPCRSFGIRN